MDHSIRKLTPDERFALQSAENLMKRKQLKVTLNTPEKAREHLDKVFSLPSTPFTGMQLAPRMSVDASGKVQILSVDVVSKTAVVTGE